MGFFTLFSMKKRTSKIWSIPKEELELAAKECSSFTAILKRFDFTGSSTHAMSNLRTRFAESNINFSHIKHGVGSNLGRKFGPSSKISLESVLVENSTYGRCHLKKRLLNLGLLKEQCALCPQGPMWNNKKLSLHIDHINGVPNDNRIENLRMLCPNCHSQTDTYAGKNLKNKA